MALKDFMENCKQMVEEEEQESTQEECPKCKAVQQAMKKIYS